MWDVLEMEKRLVETALAKIENLEQSNNRIADETEKLRLLLTRPEVR